MRMDVVTQREQALRELRETKQTVRTLAKENLRLRARVRELELANLANTMKADSGQLDVASVSAVTLCDGSSLSTVVP